MTAPLTQGSLDPHLNFVNSDAKAFFYIILNEQEARI